MRKIFAVAMGAMLALSACGDGKEGANVAANSAGSTDEAATGVPGEGGGEGGEGGGDVSVPANSGANAADEGVNGVSTSEGHSEGGAQ